jgi:ribosomal protein S4E
MGLGVDKLASLSVPQDGGEELKVDKGAYVQIISGSHRGQYGQVRLWLLHFLFSRNKV